MFFGPHDPFVQTLAEKAVVEVKRVSTEFGLPCERASGIVKLALYDFVILCGRPPMSYSVLIWY